MSLCQRLHGLSQQGYPINCIAGNTAATLLLQQAGATRSHACRYFCCDMSNDAMRIPEESFFPESIATLNATVHGMPSYFHVPNDHDRSISHYTLSSTSCVAAKLYLQFPSLSSVVVAYINVPCRSDNLAFHILQPISETDQTCNRNTTNESEVVELTARYPITLASALATATLRPLYDPAPGRVQVHNT